MLLRAAPDVRIDRASALLLDAYRVTVGVLVAPATASVERFTTAASLAASGAGLLHDAAADTAAPALAQAARYARLGAEALTRAAELVTPTRPGGIALERALYQAELAEGSIDAAWGAIADAG